LVSHTDGGTYAEGTDKFLFKDFIICILYI
jgi:hypothetical protein